MAEQEPKNAREVNHPPATQEQLKNVQQFLEHTLSCVDPECLLPYCVNMKLALKHTLGCKKGNCPVCQQMKSLASKHSESCPDFYCCMPHCMEAKLRGFVYSHFDQTDGCLDAASQSQKGEAVPTNELSRTNNHEGLTNASGRHFKGVNTTPFKTERRPSLNLNSSNESTPRQTTSTQQEEFSLLRTNSYPPLNLKRTNRSFSPSTLAARHAKSLRLQSEHRRCQSLVNQNSVTANSQWEDPLTTRTQTISSPLFTEKGSMRQENAAATKQQSLKEISSTSAVQSENILNQNATQSTDTEIQKTTDLLNTASSSSVAQACNSAPSEIGISGHVTRGSHTWLKARLIHTLYNLLHLIMKKVETREEILICITSLRNALHEVKTIQ